MIDRRKSGLTKKDTCMNKRVTKKRNRNIANKYLLLFLIVTIVNGYDLRTKKSMENTKANKAFILEMIGQKKKLEDYPDKS
jgi:hypothetical protein